MHPIELTIAEDGSRTRLTVFFRLLLVLPHVVWLLLWGIVAVVVSIVGWLITLATGRLPAPLHDFLARYVRYSTHVNAFFALVANPFPGFTGAPGTYPVDVTIAPPAPQHRAKTLFRLVLAIPAILLASAISNGGGLLTLSSASFGAVPVLAAVAFLGWWAALFAGRMPLGMRDAGALSLRFAARYQGYLFLLTDRYPSADLGGFPVAAAPEHPVTLTVADDPRRSRLTVFFRLLLVLPHLVWLYLWAIPVCVLVFVNWFVTLFSGRPAEPIHRFNAGWLRYATQVVAYGSLMANPFPGFTGAAGAYPVELTIGPPAVQNRWVTFFRIVLAYPALLLAGAIGGVLYVASFLGWWAALFTGRMPRQLEQLGTWGLRYNAQVQAYALLLTDRYPWSGPRSALVSAGEPAGPEPAPWSDAPERPQFPPPPDVGLPG